MLVPCGLFRRGTEQRLAVGMLAKIFVYPRRSPRRTSSITTDKQLISISTLANRLPRARRHFAPSALLANTRTLAPDTGSMEPAGAMRSGMVIRNCRYVLIQVVRLFFVFRKPPTRPAHTERTGRNSHPSRKLRAHGMFSFDPSEAVPLSSVTF